jgi:hypothetical protein
MGRRGVSILEVMFAILVCVVGLLGAVAVFPAASSMARKGRIADVSASAGRSSVHDFDVRGMRRPDRWVVYSSAAWDFPPPPGTPFTGYAAATDVRYPLGTAFCIDPRGVASAAQATYDQNNPVPQANAAGSLFPAFARQNVANVPGVNSATVDPRMMRVSLVSGLKDSFGNLIYNPIPANPTQQQLDTITNSMRILADATFTFDDDLSFERPDDDRSLPSRQLYDYIGGTGQNAKRLSDGHYSWMATLVPNVSFAQQFMPGGGGVIMVPTPTDQYTLSVVVFHDRELPFEAGTGFNASAERLVHGVFQGDGSTGGEIALQANAPDDLKLRPNDWVLVAGVHSYTGYNSSGNPIQMLSNVPAFQWYRVTSCDKEAEATGGVPAQQIYATLMGQDWNPSVVNPLIGPTATGSAQVTIVDGIVAVYEKTVRLEY